MTIPRLASMTRYWNENPPVHVLVAAYLGYKAPSAGERKEANSQQAIEELMANFPQVQR